VKSKLLILLLIGSFSYAQGITIGSIKNNIQIGPLAGNRDLAFGIKNILDEVIQEKGYDLLPNSDRVLSVEILYFDVKTTSMQLALYNNTEEITEIVTQAKLYNKDKEIKSVVVRGQAKSVSTSTLIIDTGGKFSQANVSSALKKVCEQIVDKLKL
jgi:uncharacterized lipoprotein YajG